MAHNGKPRPANHETANHEPLHSADTVFSGIRDLPVQLHHVRGGGRHGIAAAGFLQVWRARWGTNRIEYTKLADPHAGG